MKLPAKKQEYVNVKTHSCFFTSVNTVELQTLPNDEFVDGLLSVSSHH